MRRSAAGVTSPGGFEVFSRTYADERLERFALDLLPIRLLAGRAHLGHRDQRSAPQRRTIHRTSGQ